jgi:hypothetical protein
MSIFKNGFEVMPGRDGSFTVIKGSMRERGQLPEHWAFSNIGDLMCWLRSQGDAFSWSQEEMSAELRAALDAQLAKQTAARAAVDGKSAHHQEAAASVDHMAAVRESVSRD